MMLFNLLILSDIRFVREGLADVLAREDVFHIANVTASLVDTCRIAEVTPSPVVLLDTSYPDGIAAVKTLRDVCAAAQIVAFALTETEQEVIAWAQAGISGYIARNTPLCEFVEKIQGIVRGEQCCGAHIAAGLLRWVADHGDQHLQQESATVRAGLTARELEIVRLIGESLSNKQIARELNISVATTKSHVHNILAKLGVPRRALAARSLFQQ